MPSPITAQDICMTCYWGKGCGFLNGNPRPILQCEQFQASILADRSQFARAVPPSDRQAGDAEEETEGLLGLCRSCLNRAECTYSRPESGVWHCEEYR